MGFFGSCFVVASVDVVVVVVVTFGYPGNSLVCLSFDLLILSAVLASV